MERVTQPLHASQRTVRQRERPDAQMTTPLPQPPPRPPMRSSDTFRVVAIDDERLDRQRLEQLAAQAVHPRCALQAFAGLEPQLLDGLTPPPHLVILDDDLATGSSGETSIAWLRDHGYDGPIAILSGLRRQQRNPELVRAGAMIYLSKDDLNVAMFYELIDMAMAVSKILRARRQPSLARADHIERPPGLERRRLNP